MFHLLLFLFQATSKPNKPLRQKPMAIHKSNSLPRSNPRGENKINSPAAAREYYKQTPRLNVRNRSQEVKYYRVIIYHVLISHAASCRGIHCNVFNLSVSLSVHQPFFFLSAQLLLNCCTEFCETL